MSKPSLPFELNKEYLTTLFNYAYSRIFDQYNPRSVLILLASVTIATSFLSNLFRYLRVRGRSDRCGREPLNVCATRYSPGWWT